MVGMDAAATIAVPEEGKEKAGERFWKAEITGIDQLVWEISCSEKNNYPKYTYDVGLFGFWKNIFRYDWDWKEDSESHEDYISRIVRNGTIIGVFAPSQRRLEEIPKVVYCTHINVALKFKYIKRDFAEGKGMVIFHRYANVKGEVLIRRHKLSLKYCGWSLEKELHSPHSKRLARPDEVHFSL